MPTDKSTNRVGSAVSLFLSEVERKGTLIETRRRRNLCQFLIMLGEGKVLGKFTFNVYLECNTCFLNFLKILFSELTIWFIYQQSFKEQNSDQIRTNLYNKSSYETCFGLCDNCYISQQWFIAKIYVVSNNWRTTPRNSSSPVVPALLSKTPEAKSVAAKPASSKPKPILTYYTRFS